MEPASTRRLLVPGLLLLGLGILGLGQAWSYVVPSSAYWGPEQEKEYTSAQASLHAVTDHHGDHSHTGHNHAGHSHSAGEHHQDHQQEVAAARERFQRISSQLDQARDSHGRAATTLSVVGVGIILLGVALHFAGRPSG